MIKLLRPTFPFVTLSPQVVVLLCIFIASIAGGSIGAVSKFSLSVFHPFTLAFLRFFFAVLFLTPFVLKSRQFSRGILAHTAIVGIIGALNPFLLFFALQLTQANLSGLIYACTPALTALYLFIAHKQKLSRKKIVGICIGLIGVTTVILLPLFDKGAPEISLIGNLLIFLAAIAFSTYGIKSKNLQSKLQISPLVLTFSFAFFSTLAALPLMISELILFGFPSGVQFIHIVNALWIGVVGTGVFYIVYQYALKHGNAVTASLFTYLQPLVGVILSHFILGEILTPLLLFGGVLSLTGAVISSRK